MICVICKLTLTEQEEAFAREEFPYMYPESTNPMRVICGRCIGRGKPDRVPMITTSSPGGDHSEVDETNVNGVTEMSKKEKPAVTPDGKLVRCQKCDRFVPIIRNNGKGEFVCMSCFTKKQR